MDKEIVKQFLYECTSKSPFSSSKCSILVKTLNEWLINKNSNQVFSAQRLGRQMGKLGHESFKDNAGMMSYKGIALRKEHR